MRSERGRNPMAACLRITEIRVKKLIAYMSPYHLSAKGPNWKITGEISGYLSMTAS
jgi:hypothetical protein